MWQPMNSKGISEIMSTVLIIILVVVLAMVVYGLFTGALSGYIKKTSLVAATGGTLTIPLGSSQSTQVLSALPTAGENYFLLGQSNIPSGYPVASFTVKGPQGGSQQAGVAGYSASANRFGTPLYLYQDENYNLWVTDSAQRVAASANIIRPFSHGVYTITMVDNIANVPLTTMDVTIGSDSSLNNPGGGQTTWANGSWNLVNSSGYQIPFTNFGVTPLAGPGGTNAFYFNGSSYVTGQDNPGLQFTGDMSLSLWLKPTTAGGPLDGSGSNWGTIVGKGSIDGSGNENDNYQLVQMGNQIYFEWGDTSTGQHYNIVTQPALSNNNWNYVAVATTSTGAPVVYVNGVAQPYTIYNSNTPGVNQVGTSASPPANFGVHLDNVNNGITIGKQNAGPPNTFYYTGGMSAITFYNRALSATDVANNVQYDLT